MISYGRDARTTGARTTGIGPYSRRCWCFLQDVGDIDIIMLLGKP